MKPFLSRSLPLTLLLLSLPAHAQQNYNDPQGRFHVRAPAGWVTATRGDNYVSIQRGAAYTDILFMDLPQAQAAEDVASQIKQRWTNFQQIKRGETKLGGRAAQFIFSSGTNNRGTTMFLRVIAASLGNKSVVLMTVVPQEKYDETRGSLEQIEQSFGFGREGDGENNPPPSPPSKNPNGAGGSIDNARKLDALERACKSGVFTPEECDAKRRELNQPAQPSSDPTKLAALEKACRAGVLTPKECAEKRRTLAQGENPAPPPLSQRQPNTQGGQYDPGQPNQGGAPRPNPNRAALGIALQDISPEQARQMGLEDNRGVLVAQVVPGGPGQQAGLQPGDFIVGFERASVENSQTLLTRLAQHNPGDLVEVIVLRGGRPKVCRATLASNQAAR